MGCTNSLDHYRYYNQEQGRFTQQDVWLGRSFDPLTLNKYVYANVNPVTYTDPSGFMSLGSLTAGMNIQGILAGNSINIVSRRALNLVRKAKIYDVYKYRHIELLSKPRSFHFYMYVGRNKSPWGIRYDVFAEGGWGNVGEQLKRGNLTGRIENGWIRSSAARRSQLPGKGKKVVSLSFLQYMLWHATVIGGNQLVCEVPITYSLTPGPNCLSWTRAATAEAIVISRMRL